MFFEYPKIELVVEAIKSNRTDPNQTQLILVGEESDLDVHELIDQFNQHDIPFFGGIFPGIIYGNRNVKHGLIALNLREAAEIFLIQDIQSPKIDFPTWKEQNDTKRSAFTLVDGLSAGIAGFLKQVYREYGNQVNFIGGGAGSLTLVQKPCLFTRDGIFQDAAILCFTEKKMRLGVRHGWTKLVGPFVATKTSKNLLYELNWQNAFEVYQDTIASDSGKQINADNFFEIAKGYPFGIFRDHSEDIVRDPISVGSEGELICVGEIPENTVLYILKGEKESLIDSAEQAIKDCKPQNLDQVDFPFIVDCISRTLFLEEDFPRELNAIQSHLETKDHKNPLRGILSLGEISSTGSGLLEFYNKTTVVGIIYS